MEVRISGRRAAFAYDFDFAADGGTTVLFGPSGAGKSTIAGAITGLLTPQRGRIAHDGRVFFDAERRIDLPPERRGVGAVFQDSHLFPHLSLRGNLRYGAQGANATAITEMAGAFGLGELLDNKPSALSGGQRRRAALARALLRRPDLLILDEPLTGLDEPRRHALLDLIADSQDRFGLPCLYITHNIDEALRLSDRIAIVIDGRVQSLAPPAEAFAALPTSYDSVKQQVGTVADAVVAGHDHAAGLSELRAGAVALFVPLNTFPVGQPVRVRLRAEDVSLALSAPADSSINNCLPGTLVALHDAPNEDGAMVDAVIDIGWLLTARITRRSVQRLGLTPGRRVLALIKAVALAPRGARLDLN